MTMTKSKQNTEWTTSALLERYFVARHAAVPLADMVAMEDSDVKKWITAITGFSELTCEAEEITEYNQAEAAREELTASLLRRNRAIVAAIESGTADAWLDLEVNQRRLDLLGRADL